MVLSFINKLISNLSKHSEFSSNLARNSLNAIMVYNAWAVGINSSYKTNFYTNSNKDF